MGLIASTLAFVLAAATTYGPVILVGGIGVVCIVVAYNLAVKGIKKFKKDTAITEPSLAKS